MAITRLWFFTLQPTVSAADPAFTRLWADVLELCATYTPPPGPTSSQLHVAHLSKPCPKRAHHFLFQTTSTTGPGPHHPTGPTEAGGDGGVAREEEGETIFVFISTYPSLALCSQADAVYARQYQAQMLGYVRHRALRQMDIEDAEVVPALLLSDPRRPPGGGGGGRGAGQNGADAAAVTVTISSRDPLRSEVAESLSSPGGRTPVPPPDEEISGADVYELPPAPVAGHGDGAGEKDVFGAQRGEGRKWIRISRRAVAGGGDGDIEVFRLKELMSR